MLVRGENLPMQYPWGGTLEDKLKMYTPWGRKRAEPAKFCIEGSFKLTNHLKQVVS